MSARKILQSAAAGASGKTYVDDVFSAYTYTGNGSTQTITNGIDLAGKGGLVWAKVRGTAGTHAIFDTVRGAQKYICPNSTAAQVTAAGDVTAFNSNGFALGSDYSGGVNASGQTEVSWTFRKAPKFFDVVTYTGNGVAGRSIAHSLGTTPGMIVVKRYDIAGGGWVVYHRSSSGSLFLNATAAADANYNTYFGNDSANVAPTATDFTIGSNANVNSNGNSFVAYLFAHDASTDGLIQCGSFTSSASALSVNLGWEPQFLLYKRTGPTSDDWHIADSMRGFQTDRSAGTVDLKANTSAAEAGYGITGPTATGFTHTNGTAGDTYIYLAIRRPNKPPTTGTQVYNAYYNGAVAPLSVSVATIGFQPDLVMEKSTNGGAGVPNNYGNRFIDRARGFAALSGSSPGLPTISASSETSYVFGTDGSKFEANNAGPWSAYLMHYHFFKRAPGVFDVVCDTGTGAAHTVAHSLGVAPELIVRKTRTGTQSWYTYAAPLGNTSYLALNSTAGQTADGGVLWNSSAPTASVFSLGTGASNTNAENFVSYLFATLAGVSKVGSYTGNGSSQTINCGFAAGARFVLIKRTDSTGDWYVWDTARGIVSANDPHLSLNTTAAEVTTDDSIDPDTSGFIVNQVAATNINVTSATYIYLAIA